MIDWCHTYLVGGLLDHELGLLMHELHGRRAPTTYGVIGAYVKLWQWPNHVKKTAHSFRKLFDKQAAKSHLTAKHFGCKASDLLSLIPVLRLYFDRVALEHGTFEEGIKSILLVFNVVDMLMLTRSRHSIVLEQMLSTAIVDHLGAFYEAYGRDAGRPKHHDARHLPSQYKRFGRLSPCFVQERYHKVAKAWFDQQEEYDLVRVRFD